ncbi:MAG: hypothetical protein Q9222_000076 [Ikaeria aurantiellina]
MGSRFLDHYVGDWHRITDDDELDEHLDLYSGYRLPPNQAHTIQRSGLDRYLDCSTTGFASATSMESDEGTVTPRAEPKLEVPEQKKEDTNASLLADIEHDDSSAFNPFDDPNFQLQDEGTATYNHEQNVRSNTTADLKHEGPETTGSSTNGPALAADASLDSRIVEETQPLQRTSTEPIIQAPRAWSHHNSLGSPTSTYNYPMNNGLPQLGYPSLQAHGQMSHPRRHFSRVRAQTTNGGPTSYPHQTYLRLMPTSLRHQASTKSFLNNAHGNLGFGHSNNGISRSIHTSLSDDGREYTPSESFDSPSMRHAPNFAASGRTWDSNTFRGADDNTGRSINSYNVQSNINGVTSHYVDPSRLHDPVYSTGTSSQMLRSQTPRAPSVAQDEPHQIRRQSRAPMHKQVRQVHTEDDTETPMTIRGYELHYPNIKAARDAERPPFKTNRSRDPTIPMDDEARQEFVERMVRCMLGTHLAEDNKGMINQWQKLKQDEPRVEQAAWRLLTQKTMCKHLLGSEFTAQLVNDPTTATQRVQNNRKVNAGKKSYLDHGRRAVKTRAGKNGHRDSSNSTQPKPEESDDEALFGHMGDEDAEGDIDEEYHQHMSSMNGRVRTASGFGSSIGGTKRGLETEHFEDNGRLEKRQKRTDSAYQHHPIAPRKKIKTARDPENSRSKYQSVNGCMIDLHDKSNEAKVLQSGSEKVRAMFMDYHYPNHHVNERPRRSMRAAAPKHFVGQDVSDEAEDQDHPGLDTEDEDDEYQQGSHQQ